MFQKRYYSKNIQSPEVWKKMDLLSELRVQLVAAVSALAGLIFIGTIVYHNLEGWTWVSSFYFSVTTITTVGYGDLHPTTDVSRLFTSVYVLSGVAIALAALGIIGTNYLNVMIREERMLRRRRIKLRRSA
jgi:voltage-gated potassium channel